MECISIVHQLNVGRLVGPQAAQARPEWTRLMRGRSPFGQSSWYLAMMTRPVLTKLFNAWSMIVILIPVHNILISSQSRHLSTPNWHALNYWLAYTMTRHLFADGFVSVRPIAMKFGWDKENVSCLKFRNYSLNPTNSTGNYRWCSNLIWKKLLHLEPRCRTG